MSLRQRLPHFGSRLLRSLAAEQGVAGVAPRAAALQCTRGLSRLAAAHSTAVRAGSASLLPRVRHSALLSLQTLRQFAAASDLPPYQPMGMPSLSPTMNQGGIVKWFKKEGDSVQPGDVLCEVETDKATMEWEAQEEGFIAKILMPEGSSDIPVGTAVALLVEDEADVAAFKDYTPGAAAAATPAAAAKAAPAPPPPAAPAAGGGGGGSFPSHTVLAMPSLSPTMNQGNIIEWKKKVGEEVAAGDILAEVETDKATIEWEAQEEGFIAKILMPDGSTGIEVGAPVIVIADSADTVPAFESFTAADAAGGGAAAPAAAGAPPAAAQAAAPAAATQGAIVPRSVAAWVATVEAAAGGAPGGRVVASPYARKLAAEAGVSLAGAGGSGPGGRIVAADVQQLIASGGAAAPAAAAAPAGRAPEPAAAYAYADFTDIPNTQIRKITARRLLESKQQIPHYYLTISARVDNLQQLRQQLNETLVASSSGGKLSLNDFVVKASALALRKVPEVNSSWYPDFIRQYHNVDCSVAVQTPVGLMVPIVKDADKKGLASIAAEVKELAGRAKEGKLKPEEFTGGTFTISNLGMFGISQFAAIVNPPQACILAVGTTEKRVVAAGGGFEEATFLNCTLSCDHRVVDGAVGAQWLQAFKAYLENPATMLL